MFRGLSRMNELLYCRKHCVKCRKEKAKSFLKDQEVKFSTTYLSHGILCLPACIVLSATLGIMYYMHKYKI